MIHRNRFLMGGKSTWPCTAAVLLSGFLYADSVQFQARELFQIPFGNSRDTLGAKVEGNNFLIPRSFTLDDVGHAYIYDSPKHRIARFTLKGVFEMEFRYPETVEQVFAHADAEQNLWLLVSEPKRGLYYVVYDVRGKKLRDGLFREYMHFQLHLDDDHFLHVLLSSDKTPSVTQSFFLDEKSHLMKKENVARPPVTHHRVRKQEHVYFIDAVPGEAGTLNRITNEAHHHESDIQGHVIYTTDAGDIYTRLGDRGFRVYSAQGALKGHVQLHGLRASCASIRFDSDGNIFELDGIPDQSDEQARLRGSADPQADFEDLHYTAAMPGMRMILLSRERVGG